MAFYKGKVSSNDAFAGRSTIYGRNEEHDTAYMTRLWFGRLRLHIFHRGDYDPDHHDHPWPFWTFPIHSYVEEVVDPMIHKQATDPNVVVFSGPRVKAQVVHAWRVHARPPTHCHRVLGRWSGTGVEWDRRAIVTVVWRGHKVRLWGFLKNRKGQWCWVAWNEYIFGGGKDAPCSPPTPR